jgi:AmmeMemoRadiSam system protein B
VVSPHAGYIYSGDVAGAVLSSIEIPERVIVISPNHTGMGDPAAIMVEGQWQLPTGPIPIDSDLALDLTKECSELHNDYKAHLMEHSLEVQLPFLQCLQPRLKMVPITVSHVRFDICEKIGNAIADVIKKTGEKILIVASSDMTHYEPQEVVKKKDKMAIDKVIALDPKGLLDTCATEKITMCGVVPTAIMLVAAKKLGARKGELVKYATSGDVNKEYSAVVGYAGIIVY